MDRLVPELVDVSRSIGGHEHQGVRSCAVGFRSGASRAVVAVGQVYEGVLPEMRWSLRANVALSLVVVVETADDEGMETVERARRDVGLGGPARSGMTCPMTRRCLRFTAGADCR